MRTHLHRGMPLWLRGHPRAISGPAISVYGAAYRDVIRSSQNERGRAHATIVAGLMVVGLAGFAVVGVLSLIGAVGFGLWQLWS